MNGTQIHTVSDLITALCVAEVWYPVAGWPYEVNSWGKVRRVGGIVLSPGETHGYLHVTLNAGGARKDVRVHKLVAEAFLGPAPFPGAQVAHNDGNQKNNRADNLRWASALENQADRDRHQTKIVGADVHGAKLTDADIPVIRVRAASGESYQNIAEDYGVSISTISLIKLRKIWKHIPEFSLSEAA